MTKPPSEEERKQMIQLYQAGLYDQEMAAKLGTNGNAISARRRKLGLISNKERRLIIQDGMIEYLGRQGFSGAIIQKRLKVSDPTVRTKLRNLGLYQPQWEKNTEENSLQLVKLLAEHGPMSTQKASELMGVCMATVLRAMRKNIDMFESLLMNINRSASFSHQELIDLDSRTRIIMLRSDPRLIEFLASHVPQPRTYEKVLTLRYKLTSIIGSGRAWQVCKACGFEFDRGYIHTSD